MKSIQEHLRQLLQTVPTPKVLWAPLCLDALFEQPSPRYQSNNTLHRPYLFAKAMDGFLKYNGNRAI